MTWKHSDGATIPEGGLRPLVGCSGTQSVPDGGTSTQITYSSVPLRGYLVSGSVVTVREAGTYYVIATGKWAANSTGNRRFGLQKNGSDVAVHTSIAMASFETTQQVYFVTELAAGDELSIYGKYQNSGGDLTCTGWIAVYRVEGL